MSANHRPSLEAHIAAERSHDLDAVMASLSDDVSYIIPGYLLSDRAAVRAMYERVLHLFDDAHFDEYLRALDDPAVTRWGADHCVLEYTDDYASHRNMIVVVHFAGGKVRSENTYSRGPARITSEWDKAFLALPGVIPLT